MQDVIYQPEPGGPNWKGPILLVVPVLFIVVWIIAGDTVSRLLFLAFATTFIALAILGTKYHRARFSYPLRLDATGITWSPFIDRYGVEKVPWQEIDRVDMFRGTYGGVGPGPRWLRLFLREGDFLRKLKRPLGEQAFGGDVNVALVFEVEPEKVVKTVRQFHEHYGC